MISLLAFLWFFNTLQPAQSILTVQTPQAGFATPSISTTSFTIKLVVDIKNFTGKQDLLEIPEVLTVTLNQHDPLDRDRQNYPAFRMSDGSVPVLEATLVLHSTEHPDLKNMTVGIPVAMLKKPFGEHEIVLNFSGVRWSMYADGQLLDNDFPFGYPQWGEKNTWKMNREYVTKAALYLPGIKPEKQKIKDSGNLSEVQYWTPPGHNSWVGDVVTIFNKGRYHIFYLYDRRHHQSKFGKGAHYFEHLSTVDFKTWTEHEAATPLDEQWECIGTGTPFVFKDKFYLSYGLHTGRVYSEEETTWPAQWDYLKKYGFTGTFNRLTTSGIPAGATYSVSENGISEFKKSGIMFHPCQNPSVYTNPDGKLRMLANAGSKGMWESDSVAGGWRCIDPEFPPGGDCTFFFHWGKYDYIIGGFTGLWSKPANSPNRSYEDVVSKGFDFYDGSNVPAITEIQYGRFLMAAWIPIHGWGGNLVIRELVQFPDGRIGSKWMKEITPQTDSPKLSEVTVNKTTALPVDGKSFMLTFEVHPSEVKGGRIGISFLPEKGEQASCELQISLDDLRAQFGPGSLVQFAGKEKSLREGAQTNQVGNYAIENIIGTDRPFEVRIIVKHDIKIGGSLIDAEIAGKRTMITYRPDLMVKKIFIHLKETELKDLEIASLKNL